MAALLPARLSRLAICTICLLLATAGLTFAAAREQTAHARSSGPPATLVVPDVRRQAYVFAKTLLEDAGFAWRVEGAVDGFAVNLVASQKPPPGARVLDTGAPTISLQLDRNAKYAETGVPENFSPYAGTRVLRPGAKHPRAAARPRPAVRPRPAARPRPRTQPPVQRPEARKSPTAKPRPARPRVRTQPRVQRPEARKSPTAKPHPARPRVRTQPRVERPAARKRPTAKRPVHSEPPVKRARVKRAAAPAKRKSVGTRPAAFHVPGVPREPVHEMPLPKRAWLLGVWLKSHPRATYANVDHWLYQHAWVVTGAKFGWWRGTKALRILIAVDGRVISAWGIGARSREVARAALAEVRAKKS
jgi:PASTA domain